MSKRGFTLIELTIVVLILGILAAMGIARYQKAVEKGKAAEAIIIFEKMRAGYQARIFDNLPVTIASGFNPNFGGGTDDSWRALGMDNPNALATTYFTISYWDAAASAGMPQVGAARNVAIAFRKNDQVAHSLNVDAAKWLYMDLDTGQVVKSAAYQ